ncbi:MAG: T9SS C-terminal target domain-containing protein, partial [Cytophagales bacterium]
NSISVANGFASTASGLNYSNFGKYNGFGNKIYYTIPYGMSVANTYITIYANNFLTTITSGATTFSKSSAYFTSNSMIGTNMVTTITAKAQNGSVRNYELEFINTTNAVYNNEISQFNLRNYSSTIFQNKNEIYLSGDINSTILSGIQVTAPKGSTVSIDGINIPFYYNSGNEQVFYLNELTLTSNNFDIKFTGINEVTRTYKGIKIQKYEEQFTGSTDLEDANLSVSNNTFIDKATNTVWFYAPFGANTTLTNAYFYLTKSGSFKIDGSTNTGTSMNWSNQRTLTIFDANGNLTKTYTVKTFVQPLAATVVTGTPAGGGINNFYIRTENGIQYTATISGSAINVNIPIGNELNKLNYYYGITSGAVFSIPGLLNNNYTDYNFSNPVPALVYLPDGSTLNYTITVNNTILPTFVAPVLSSVAGFSYMYIGKSYDFYLPTNDQVSTQYTVSGSNIDIILPFKFNQSKIDINFPSANIKVNGYGFVSDYSFNTFDLSTTPLTVTSFAPNGIDTKVYIITVKGKNSASTLTSLNFYQTANTSSVSVNENDETITYNFKTGHDLTQSVPYFKTSHNEQGVSIAGVAQISQISKVDLTTPKIYTVLAEDGITTAEFTVSGVISTTIKSTLTGLNMARIYTGNNPYSYHPSYSTGGISGTCIGDNFLLTLTGNYTSKVFPLYLDLLDDNSIALINGVPQYGSIGYYDFNSPVTVVVRSENGNTKSYTVGVTTTVNGVPVLGLEDIEQETLANVVVYPNPTSDSDVTVANISTSQIVVYSSIGNVVYSTKATGEATLPTSSLNKGLYFVKITSGKSSITKKIVVE